LVIADILVILVVILIKIRQVILVNLLECEGFPSEPVDGPRNQLLLDVLTQLVVKLEPLFNVRGGIVIVIAWGLGRREEVEEGLSGNCLLDDASLLGGCVY
jgi:hypothetical protein